MAGVRSEMTGARTLEPIRLDELAASLATEPGRQLGTLVRAWRKRLVPDQTPGLGTSQGRSRRRRRVSQEEIAVLTGYSVGWYGSLERGETQNYSPDFLEAVADTLRLTHEERTLLFLYATGSAPAAHNPTHTTHSLRELQIVLDAQPWPAYLTDPAWNIVGYNQHMLAWFPWVAESTANAMRWAFTSPEARLQLCQWATDWAPKLLSQLRNLHASSPEDQQLNEVVAEVLTANSTARRLWERPLVEADPDGDRRHLDLPQHGKIAVHMVTLEPLRSPGSRMTLLIPDHGA